jgi:hypothetical protein
MPMHADHQTSRQLMAPMIAIALASTAIAGSAPAWAQAGGSEVTFEERAIVQQIPGARNPEIEIEVERREMHGADQGDHALEAMDHWPHHPMRDHPAGHRQIAPAIHPGAIFPGPLHSGPFYPGAMYPGQAMDAPIYFPQSTYRAGAMPYADGIHHDQMGREEWLEDCRTRHHGRGGRRGAPDECAAYLVQHDAQWQQMRYGYGPVMLVPIMVPVQQRAVVREYVTEEWVEEVTPAAPAPRPVKTVPVTTKSGKPGK